MAEIPVALYLTRPCHTNDLVLRPSLGGLVQRHIYIQWKARVCQTLLDDQGWLSRMGWVKLPCWSVLDGTPSPSDTMVASCILAPDENRGLADSIDSSDQKGVGAGVLDRRRTLQPLGVGGLHRPIAVDCLELGR